MSRKLNDEINALINYNEKEAFQTSRQLPTPSPTGTTKCKQTNDVKLYSEKEDSFERYMMTGLCKMWQNG